MRRKAKASCSQARADSMVASKSFDRRLARLIQPSVRSTTQRFGSTIKPFIFVGSLDDGDGNTARLEGGALGFITLITPVDEGHFHPRALASTAFEQRRESVAILHVGGRDLAFDGQTDRVDGEMALAALDFLAASKPRGPPASVVLTDWLSTTTAVGAA